MVADKLKRKLLCTVYLLIS